MSSYVVLHPNSHTNPSKKYRVVDYLKWTEHTNSHLATPLPVESEHDTHDEAREAADKLNA